MALLELLFKHCELSCVNAKGGCDYVFTGRDKSEYREHINKCKQNKITVINQNCETHKSETVDETCASTDSLKNIKSISVTDLPCRQQNKNLRRKSSFLYIDASTKSNVSKGGTFKRRACYSGRETETDNSEYLKNINKCTQRSVINQSCGKPKRETVDETCLSTDSLKNIKTSSVTDLCCRQQLQISEKETFVSSHSSKDIDASTKSNVSKGGTFKRRACYSGRETETDNSEYLKNINKCTQRSVINQSCGKPKSETVDETCLSTDSLKNIMVSSSPNPMKTSSASDQCCRQQQQISEKETFVSSHSSKDIDASSKSNVSKIWKGPSVSNHCFQSGTFKCQACYTGKETADCQHTCVNMAFPPNSQHDCNISNPEERALLKLPPSDAEVTLIVRKFTSPVNYK